MYAAALQTIVQQALNWARRLGLALGLMSLGAILCYVVMRNSQTNVPGSGPHHAEKKPSGPEEVTVVRMPENRWEAAGIRIEPAGYSPYVERVWRSGHLSLDETRLAHVSPVVEGLVREVKVRLGQEVRAGEVLAVLDSREVGQAKLDLVKARLASRYAKDQHAWTQTTSQAALDLVQAMLQGKSIADIEQEFRNRPIGDLRQQLMTAYSRRLQVRTHYQSAQQADRLGVVPPAGLVRQRADYEAAEATYRALCEDVTFQSRQNPRASEQKLREAETAESLCRGRLMLLGFSPQEVDAMDPLSEGMRVSLYPIRAPFSGTVVEQHAVLSEQVGPQHQLFQLADLGTLWLKADVPQTELALVRDLAGGKIKFRATEADEEEFEAVVFYTGDVVDRDTRSVSLTALVQNPQRRLKPGVFVEVELTRSGATVVQVPAAAVQRQGTQAFVFVHQGGEEFRRVDVKVGKSLGGVAEVLEGLQQGQPVVVAGGFVLKSELLKDQIAGD